jgi:hypothetical protein
LSEIGGVIGLISGLIVLHDRYYKARPIASLTIRETGSPLRKLACIRIKNTTPHDVAILGANNRQGIYFLAVDEEVRTLLEGAAGTQKFAFMLKPDETKELIIKAKVDGGIPLEVVKNRYIEFFIWWRRGDSTWMPRLPVLVCSTTTVIRQLAGVE